MINHLAIILDGNRRYAKKIMLDPTKGHEFGANTVEQLLEWCIELKIKELTLYAFSIENFNRSKIEVDYLMKIFNSEFEKLIKDERIKKLKINFIGKLSLFPNNVKNNMIKLMDLTKDNKDLTVNFAMGYGGKTEIIEAINKIIRDVKTNKIKSNDINEEMFENYLYLKSNPDLIIRTGGVKRTSNFLMWQSSYSEYIFLDITWPEFTKQILIDCIKEFENRERRFGK